jgi:2-dehydro-3-deoxygluconokinase
LGDCTLMEIRKHVINTKNVIRGGDRLGIYFMETGDFSRGSKVVYDRAYSSISEIQPNMLDWKKILEGVNWFHWTGITPNINYFKKMA